jgi:hypothetical protein
MAEKEYVIVDNLDAIGDSNRLSELIDIKKKLEFEIDNLKLKILNHAQVTNQDFKVGNFTVTYVEGKLTYDYKTFLKDEGLTIPMKYAKISNAYFTWKASK